MIIKSTSMDFQRKKKMKPLCEKYRCRCFADVKGQDLAIKEIKKFISEFPKKKSIVLHGQAGTGKTSLAHVLAGELKKEIFELNASMLRNRQKLDEVLKPALQQESLFSKGKIILIDEVDGVSGYKDRGGIGELSYLIDKTAFPIIITANDIWDKKFSPIRQKAHLVKLENLSYELILEIIKDIGKKENLGIQEDILKTIAIKSKGDVRAAINDLQSVGEGTKIEDLDERNKEESIFNALKMIFKTTNLDTNAFDSVNMNLDEIFLWIEENIPYEYEKQDLERAYNALSIADVFRGRIRKNRHYRFMVYENFFLTAGISSSKTKVKFNFTPYKKPTRVLKIWLNNQKIAKKKSIMRKYALYSHMSVKKALQRFQILKPILKKPEIWKELRLTERETEYLKNLN